MKHTQFLPLLMPLALWACTRTVYMPTAHTSTTHAASARTDTLVVLDSVVVEPRGDTVYHTRERTVYRTSTLRDTLLMERTDTVTVVIPAQPTTSGRTSIWRRIAIGAGAAAIALLWLLRRLRR